MLKKKMFVVISAVLISAFTSCSSPVPATYSNNEINEEKINFSITLPGKSYKAVYTIDDADKYRININNTAGLVVSKEGLPGETVSFSLQEEGTYTIEVIAFDINGIEIARGSTTENLKYRAEIIPIEVKITPKKKDININVNITWETETKCTIRNVDLPESIGEDDFKGHTFENNGRKFVFGDDGTYELFIVRGSSGLLPNNKGTYSFKNTGDRKVIIFKKTAYYIGGRYCSTDEEIDSAVEDEAPQGYTEDVINMQKEMYYHNLSYLNEYEYTLAGNELNIEMSCDDFDIYNYSFDYGDFGVTPRVCLGHSSSFITVDNRDCYFICHFNNGKFVSDEIRDSSGSSAGSISGTYEILHAGKDTAMKVIFIKLPDGATGFELNREYIFEKLHNGDTETFNLIMQ